MRADIPRSVKIEAFFHLTNPMVYLYVTLMIMMFYTVMALNVQPFGSQYAVALLGGMCLLVLGTVSASVFARRSNDSFAIGD